MQSIISAARFQDKINAIIYSHISMAINEVTFFASKRSVSAFSSKIISIIKLKFNIKLPKLPKLYKSLIYRFLDSGKNQFLFLPKLPKLPKIHSYLR